MSMEHCLIVLTGIVVVLMILLSLEAHAESAVDYSPSCSSCTLGEVVSLIKDEFRDVKKLIAANQLSTVEASKQALASALVREYNSLNRLSHFDVNDKLVCRLV